MLISWCCFLLLSHFLCHVHPKECNNTYEYEGENIHCCKKCGPGERMDKRCTKDFDTKCKQCTPDFFMDEFSTEMECKRCSQCTKEHMVYKVNCSHSTDAVCGCENGYECPSNSCTDCVKIPTTTPRPTPTPSTTTITVISKNVKKNEQQTIPSEDIVWITLSLCCVCILLTCFILISRHTTPCGWPMLASAGFFGGPKKTFGVSSQCTEDEEVPMPVQEVCGYKDWQEEA
ncbi:tumor necrosis factor receptor superfamily member 19 isoform X2 [Pangasianodon hypophthalmus]|uniref:tumor necrosis factor receptor superfamily member 19 isoform X2 n=1 Tax=Pangasianodon hypophthalmus TaxID=310915 RepID=UPI0023080126|nr:tumor necrosis factor receptor superfamily member 19 isoform X2 [Pangasianodon hypophthalmus]